MTRVKIKLHGIGEVYMCGNTDLLLRYTEYNATIIEVSTSANFQASGWTMTHVKT